MHKKSQAALEYLSTYGWALLVVIVTLAILYSSGLLNYNKLLPSTCTFTSQFECIDFDVDHASSQISFLLVNSIGETIHVDNISISDDAARPLSCIPSQPSLSDWNNSVKKDFNLTDCTGGAFVRGERLNAKVELTYYSTTTGQSYKHKLFGRLIGVVE